jgi:RNA polymerase sigma-70 factor (ECF subfamily)
MSAATFEVMKGFNRQLHRYLMRRLRNPNDVEDLAQEVYERLLRIPHDRGIEKPLPYLYGIASHVLADYRIDVEEDRKITDSSDEFEDWPDTPACVLPDDMAERLNLQQQIDAAMAQLPPTHAAVLLAHKRDGMSYEECAEFLGLSIFTIEKYVSQAKARIRVMNWER